MRYSRAESPFSLTPWVRGLLIANAVVYLLQLTVFTGPWLVEAFGFSAERAGRNWWSLGTYMFVHAGFLHLAFNMLMLFFFGPAVEARMGGTSFALYYLVCGLGGAALAFPVSLLGPTGTVIGASAAVFGVSLAFARYWPDTPIYVFPLPVPVKAKWLVAFLAGTALFATILQVRSGVAHFAHLGGFLFGFVYLKGEEAMVKRARTGVKSTRPVSRIGAPRRRAPASVRSEEESTSDRGTRRGDVDRVLDKISKSGIDSLTPDERQLLHDMSRELREH